MTVQGAAQPCQYCCHRWHSRLDSLSFLASDAPPCRAPPRTLRLAMLQHFSCTFSHSHARALLGMRHRQQHPLLDCHASPKKPLTRASSRKDETPLANHVCFPYVWRLHSERHQVFCVFPAALWHRREHPCLLSCPQGASALL